MPHDAVLCRGAGRVVRHMVDIVGQPCVIRWAGQRPWASATFDGLRLAVQLELTEEPAPEDLRAICLCLEQADYGVAKYLVADVQAAGKARMIDIEALLIRNA